MLSTLNARLPLSGNCRMEHFPLILQPRELFWKVERKARQSSHLFPRRISAIRKCRGTLFGFTIIKNVRGIFARNQLRETAGWASINPHPRAETPCAKISRKEAFCRGGHLLLSRFVARAPCGTVQVAERKRDAFTIKWSLRGWNAPAVCKLYATY
jgi:hypothetical protein